MGEDKNKWNEFVRSMTGVDLERIKFYSQKVNRLCRERNVEMIKLRKSKGRINKKNKWTKKNLMMNCYCEIEILIKNSG